MSFIGQITIKLISIETGLEELVLHENNLVTWNTLSLIFDGNQVFKDCFIGVSDNDDEPRHDVHTITGEVSLAKTELTGFHSSDRPDVVGLLEAPYGFITGSLEPNIFRTRKISSVFLTRKSNYLLSAVEPDRIQSIDVLTHCKLREPVFQERNQRLVIDYRIQFINFGSSELVRVNKTFPDKLGRYLFGFTNYSNTSGLLTVSSSFTHKPNNTYLNLLFELIPENLKSTRGSDFYLRYLVELLGVTEDSDPTIGKIIGSLGYGNENYIAPLSKASIPFTYAPICPDNSCDHQGTFYHFPGDKKPFLEKPYPENPVGVDIRDLYASQIIFSGHWQYKHWPEFYRINFTQTGLLPDVDTDSPVAAYTFSYRHHLGFKGNTYVSDLCVSPFLSPIAYKGIHLFNKKRYSETKVLCWDKEGISIIDLISGEHSDFSFDGINQVEINSEGVVYIASEKGLFELFPADNVISEITSVPTIGVAVGFNNTVYAVDKVGLRVSYLNFDYYRKFDPTSIADEEHFYSRDIQYRICQRLLIRENEIKFIKASPIKNQIGLVVKMPLRHYKIVWWDLDKDLRSLGPDIDYTESNYLKEELRTDWVECSKPSFIGKYSYPSVWFFVDSTGTYNTEFNSTRKTKIADKNTTLCHVSLYDNEPFIFTSKDLRDPTGFVLAKYEEGTKLGSIRDLLGTITHLYKGICLISSISNTDIPSYLSVLGTDGSPWGSETSLDLYQSFAYCKLWNHFVWDREEKKWLPDFSFEPPEINVDDKPVHYLPEPLINGVEVSFQLVYDFKPIEIVKLPNIPITAICFDELLIDDFIVANADTITWTQKSGRKVTILSENTTRPFIRRRPSLGEDDGTDIVITAEICNPRGCIYVDIPIFLTPTSTHDGFTIQVIQDDRECKKVPCKIRPAQEVYVDPPVSLFGHRFTNSIFPLVAIYWDLPTCELDYLESTTVQVNVEGTYRDVRTYLPNERRIFLASVPNWYRIKSRFNNFGIISESFSCVFYITPDTFGNHKQSLTDDSYDRGFSVNSIESTTRLILYAKKVEVEDSYDGFSINAVQLTQRFTLDGREVVTTDAIASDSFGGMTINAIDITTRLGLGGIIIG